MIYVATIADAQHASVLGVVNAASRQQAIEVVKRVLARDGWKVSVGEDGYPISAERKRKYLELLRVSVEPANLLNDIEVRDNQ
jgi:hypothetical protein